MASTERPVLLLAGAADGLGARIARTFAEAGHDILGLSRGDHAAGQLERAAREGGGSYAHAVCDLTEPSQVAEALRPHLDSIVAVVYNAAALMMKPFIETTPAEFELAWRVASLGAFVTSQSVLPRLLERGSGTLILSGATASRRGGAKFAAFASAKFALRGLAQALSREFGPQGIHVAHVVLDGLIDAAQTDRRFGPGSKRMDPDAIARAYLYLSTQPPSAWTHELDLRSSAERY